MTITTFPYRIDRCDADGISEHLADIDDLIVARAIYEAAGERITQGARVIEDSRKTSVS